MNAVETGYLKHLRLEISKEGVTADLLLAEQGRAPVFTDGRRMIDPRQHLESCSGCSDCDNYMDFYTACDQCGHWMHKSAVNGYYYSQETGETLCALCEPKNDDTAEDAQLTDNAG